MMLGGFRMYLRRSIFLVAFLAFAPAPETAVGQDALDPIRFEGVGEKAGIRFAVNNSATPAKHLIETMIAGVAVFDYDDDGKPDIYFVNGAKIPEKISYADGTRIPDLRKRGPEFQNRLYRNEGNGTFTDVTVKAGVPGAGYGMGVATADFDNDGFADIFLPGVNHNILYHNKGDGTFEDVTKRAGLAGIGPKQDKPWSVAAGWFDYDNDGHLDLFVVNYLLWDLQAEPLCGDAKAGFRTYCDPRLYKGLPNTLYRNNGDGSFTDVSQVSGIASAVGKGMAVAFADYDQDRDLDVIVTNDTEPNFLFRNNGRGRFEEIGMLAGVAYNDNGRAVSSMGAGFRDIDNDGLEDFFVSALANETFPLFRNLGKGFFVDDTHRSLVAKATLTRSGWSVGLFDFNNDGSKDILVAAGDVQDNTELFSSRKAKQSNVLLANVGNGKFVDYTGEAGGALAYQALHRGLAFGDFDLDGRVDAVLTRLNERAELLRNTSPSPNHWLAFRLTGRSSNRDAIGARIHIVGKSGREQWNHVTTSTGYGCSSEKTVFFGLGKDDGVKVVEIQWPSGITQTLSNVEVDRYLDLQEPAKL